jgi:ribonuclease HI
VKLSTDGGARGNPGPAAYGYVLEAEDGTVLAAHGETIGIAKLARLRANGLDVELFHILTFT